MSQRLAVPLIGNRFLVQDSITLEAPRSLCMTGAVFSGGGYDFVLEGDDGYHVLAQGDSATSAPIAFLRLPGTSELSAVGPVLLANSYGDLLRLRLDVATRGVTVLSTLPNILAPVNGFAVEESELLTGFEVRDVQIQQGAGGIVFAAWRCPSCFEPVDGEVRSNSPGVVTIVTSDRFASLALGGLDAFVADGRRLTSYQSVGETFVKTGERDFEETFLALQSTGGAILAELNGRKSLIDPKDLSSQALPAQIGSCDLSTADENLLIFARNPKSLCGSKLTDAVEIFDRPSRSATPQLIGTLDVSGVVAMATYRHHLYVATSSAVHVYDREPTQGAVYEARQLQLLSTGTPVRQLAISVDGGLGVSLVTESGDGIRRYTISERGTLSEVTVYTRDQTCR